MKYLAIRELHEDQDYSINWMCRKLEISRAAYYKWLNRDIPAKELEDIEIAGKIEERHERYGGILGYRRMTIFLNREEGTDYKPKRIRRIMRITGIHSSIRSRQSSWKELRSICTEREMDNRCHRVQSPGRKRKDLSQCIHGSL